MAINPATGKEDPKYNPGQPTDMTGKIDTTGQTPAGAQSFGIPKTTGVATPAKPQTVLNDTTNIGGLSTEQYGGLKTRFNELTSQGLNEEDATSRLRGELETAGVYDTAKNLYTGAGQQVSATEGTTGQVQGGMKTVEGGQPGAVSTTIDTSKLSPEELAYYNAQKTRIDAIGAKKGMEAAIKDMQAELKLDKEKKFATDVEKAMQYTKDEAARQAEIARIQDERNLKDANDKLAKQVENAARFKGAVGFPQTQAALKAQQGNIDRTRQVISEMQSIQQLQKEGASAQLTKRMNDLQDQLDLNVSKAVQETMTNLQTLITSGKLDSVEAIIKAKTDLMDGLNSKYNDFLNNTFEASQFALEQAETQLKNYRESQKYNDEFTKQMGDGFMYNVNGQKMTDASGNPLKASSTSGKPLSTTPITLNDGSLAMIYQNPDGTVRTEKLEGTKPVQLTPQALVKYSDLVSRGAISVDDLRQLGFSREDINTIVSQVTPETTTKLKNVTIEDAEGNKIPASYNETTGEYTVGGQVYSGDQIKSSGVTVTSGTDLRSAASKYPNEASLKNNNPAGITFNNNFAATLTNAGIQFTKGTARPSAEGGNYFSFPNIEEGFKAYDLLWNSPSYTNLTVGKALQRWGTGSLPGVDTTKKVGDLTQSEKEQLQIAQLRKESPGMYKELVANGYIGAGGIEIPEVTKQVGGEVMGSAGVPLSYQRRIEQMVPVQLRNSDAESKKLMADIKNMQKAGLSPEDATLMYLGFNVTDKNIKDEAMNLVSQARGLGEALPEDFFIKLSDYVNKGNIAGAKSFTDRVVEGTIKKQVGEDFVSTPNLKFAESTLARVENLINRNKDKIGPLSGRIADLEKKLVNDPDYQALKTLLSGSLADTRRAFGGTAVSQSELEALKDFIGLDTKMPIENLLSGLRTNLDTLKDKYNQQRGFYLGEENKQKSQPPATQNKSYSKYFQ